MARRYMFSDESGDLQFKRKDSTRFFAVGTLLIDEAELARLRSTMARLRDELAWRNHGLNSTFHAATDSPKVREIVFTTLKAFAFQFDVTMLDKPKAQPQTRKSDATFFQYAWFYHMKFVAPRVLHQGDELLVVAASIGTKRGRAAFRNAIEGVLTQCIDFRVKRTLAFWRDESDFALQAADYCAWAVMRKWEQGDDSYYTYISTKISREYDLWARGTTLYY